MSRRWLIAIPGLAALAFAAIMFYIIIQIDQTRKQLQADGVLEFNFIQQVNHNYDRLSQAITDYLAAENSTVATTLRDVYIVRYDVLYSSILNVGESWLGNLHDQDGTKTFLRDSKAFVNTYEPLMNANVVPQLATLIEMNNEARDLSQRVYEIGLDMFQLKSLVRRDISERMNDLYEAFWIFALSFLFATLLTLAFLFALTRRAESLTADAKQTRSQLTTALDELTTGDIERRAQNRFMAAASHDLRQPLHALGLYMSALTHHVSTHQGKTILANIHRSTDALNQLLNSMLDLSKLDAGVVDVNYEKLNIDVVLDHVRQMFLPEANQRKLLLQIHHSGIHVYSDRVLLERILSNLVSNALNYTPEGSVTISASATDSAAFIYVTDTGVGIPLQEQEAVFNEYYQLQNPERDRTKGLGLGLSIVKRLTRLLDIKLTVQSETEKGTTFELQLRLDNVNQHSDTIDNLTETTDAHTQPANLSGLSILVIDDEHDVRDGTSTLLEQQNCDIVMADSPEQACEHIVANSWVPDLIIADYRLRDDTTGDMAIELVRDEINMDVPAMIITGDTSPERLREAAASGFPLLHKPVVADDLISTIAKMIGNQQ